MIDEEDRTNFIAGAEEALNSGRYPKLEVSVYFDSQDSTTGQNCLIGNATYRPGNPTDPEFGGIEVTYTPMVSEGGPSNEPLFNAYRSFVASDYFAQNDVRRALSPKDPAPARSCDA